MTLPSELLGLIEALITAKADESRPVTVEERRESPVIYTNRLMVLEAARTALIAGIQRYREEGQEAAAQVADEFVVRNDERSKDLRLSQRDRDLCEARSSAAYRVARSIRALRPTPPEEPKP